MVSLVVLDFAWILRLCVAVVCCDSVVRGVFACVFVVMCCRCVYGCACGCVCDCVHGCVFVFWLCS